MVIGRRAYQWRDCPMKTINYTITTITATNNIAVAMFANKKYIYKTARNNKVALLETLKAILNKALPSDELMEKPVLIITTQSILKGFTTGGFIDYIRTGEDANGNKFADDELALIKECAELYASRALNVRFIDEKMISPKDKEATTIKRNAFDTVKLLAKQQAVQNTKVQTQTQPAPETNSTIALLNSEMQKAIREGNVQLASEYAKMIAQLNAPQQAPVAQPTNEVEVPEDKPVVDPEIKEEMDKAIGVEEDPTAGSDEIEL